MSRQLLSASAAAVRADRVGGDASTSTDPLDESDSGTPSINEIVTFDADDYYT